MSASYQQRKASVNQATVGWRDGYLGSADYAGEWGALPNTDGSSWNSWNSSTDNRPGDTDVYAIPQNADYAILDIDRQRLNGQVVLQYAPTDRLTGTLDYTYSQNEIEVRNSSVGIWFNHAYTNSAWTDGPIAGPIFYSEVFGDANVYPGYGDSDLSMSGSLTANQSENKSLGFNLEWQATDSLALELDYHDSSAESKPNNRFGTNMSLGTTVISLVEQGVNFENDLPIISFSDNGIDPLDPANRLASGSAFRNATFRNDLDQLQLTGHYDVDPDIFASGKFVDTIDFGVSMVNNKVNSAFGVLQNETWGGLGTPGDIPDEFFTFETLPDKFDGISGANDPSLLAGFQSFNFEQMADFLESQFQICSNPQQGASIDGTCLAEQTTNRVIDEETVSAFVQFNNTFELMGRDAHLTYGARYETTDVTSSAIVPIPIGTAWSDGANELYLQYGTERLFETRQGNYSFFLPSVDFDMMLSEYVKVRTSYGKSITRPTYNNLVGGTELTALFRPDPAGGFASTGNPGLPPNESKNFDLSVEWYYDDLSFVSLGYFNKQVKNFVGSDTRTENFYDLRDPSVNSGFVPGLAGGPGDPLLDFRVSFPTTNDQAAGLDGYEASITHNFGESGFGVIGNYTIVNGDFSYDDTQPYRTSQFTLTGLSDSANLIAFYDKNGLQGRLAYNWRDKFLGGNGANPAYTEEYGQLDANISYEIGENWTVFAESINLTGEDRRGHRRHVNNVTFVSPGEPRYTIGARWVY